MSVVFERQLNNIKEGLQAINQMKVSMESLKGSDSNLMREGISQIQEANQNLNITQQSLTIIKNKAKNSIVFKQGIKSAKTLITQLKVLKALLGDLYTKTKAIVFGGLGVIFGGFMKVGGMMSSAKNQASQGKGLGLNLAQLKALQNAGKIKTGDESFYVNAFKSIKDNATSEGSAKFATLGLNYVNYANMNDPTLMFKDFNKIALKLSKMKAQDKETLEESFKAITGLSSSEFYKQNSLKEYNDQVKDAKAAGLDKMVSAGESFDRMIIQFQTTMYAIVSKLSPFIKQISDAFNKGLRDMLNNKEFKNLLESFGNAMTSFGKNLSGNIIDFFKKLPSYIKEIKDFIITTYEVIKSVFLFIIRAGASFSDDLKKVLHDLGTKELNKLINKGNFNVKDLLDLDNKYTLEYVKDKEIFEMLKNKYKTANNKDISQLVYLIRSGYASTGDLYEKRFNNNIQRQLNILNATVNVQNADGSVTQTTQQITIPQGR